MKKMMMITSVVAVMTLSGCAATSEMQANGCHSGSNPAGAVVGAVAGGVLGSTIGGGSGRTAATVIGAGVGGVAGSKSRVGC